MSLFDDIGAFLDGAWKAIVEAFSSVPPPAPVQACACPLFEAHIIGVRFLSPIQVARRGATISGEHWSEGDDLNEPNLADGSKKAAVVRIAGRGDPRMRLRIRVTRSHGVGPTGPVTGTLGAIAFSGIEQCPTGVGDHTITARIDELRPSIARDAGDASWQMTVDPVGAVSLGSTRLEVVTILDTPPAFYAGGVWIEVLRVLIKRAGVVAHDRKRLAAGAVAQFEHVNLDLFYDTVGGAPKFNSTRLGANAFLLAKLISPISGKIVNCFDTAAGLTAMAGALGIELGWKFMQPFGFLAPTHLIGVDGQCNNPFFNGTVFVSRTQKEPAFPLPMAPPNDTHRSSFGNHAFTSFGTAVNVDLAGPDGGVPEGIGDSCAGPATFAGSLPDYVLAAVDQNRPFNDARLAALQQFAAIDAFERNQLVLANALPGATDEQKQQMFQTIRGLAEQARQGARAALAATETINVVNGFGVNSLQFAAYSGP